MTYYSGTASLLSEIDKKLMVVLRDGRTLIGYLRSIDQYANLVLHGTIERIHVGMRFGDLPRGVLVIRGENLLLLGEVDAEKEALTRGKLEKVSIDEILILQKNEQDHKKSEEEKKKKKLTERGLSTFPVELQNEDY